MRASTIVTISALALALALAPALSACGDSELDPEVVTSIPPGDGSGTGASGRYRLEIQTLSCSGSCPTFSVGIFTIRLCTAGDSDTENVQVVQSDGVLEVKEIGSSMYVENLRGGINKDGSFDVGGYQVQSGTNVAVTARARGTIAGDTFTAEAKVRGTGDYDGKTIACSAAYSISGQRR
jgi:hypothetical protein